MYYPKSQIKTNLFTNGGEYNLSSNGNEYIGYYYETSTGNKYTGKTPQDLPNLLLNEVPSLTPSSNDPQLQDLSLQNLIQTYNTTPNYTETLPDRLIPIFTLTLPTDQDKVNGQFNRYFCKKNNEIKYLEIDKNTYQQLQSKDPKIAWDLYTPVIILWVIQGNQTQVFNSNKATVQAIEQNAKWYGFSQYFQDKFLKYYLGS